MDNTQDKQSFTVNNLADALNITTSNVIYYLKKHEDDLQSHLSKKSSAKTSPYILDEYAYNYLYNLINNSMSNPAASSPDELLNDHNSSTANNTNELDNTLIIKQYEERLAEQKKYSEELLNEKDNTIAALEQTIEQLKSANEQNKEIQKSLSDIATNGQYLSGILLKLNNDSLSLTNNPSQKTKRKFLFWKKK